MGVIVSRERAPKYGPGHLLVDGNEQQLCRKAKLAFKPTPRQEASLLGLLAACAEVYNAGLQERRDAWRRSETRIGLYDQFNQITHLRGVRDDTLAWGTQPLRSTLRRVDEAYSAFYRRVANCQTPGHPRFKSTQRFDTGCWDEPTGWAIDLGGGTLRIQGVGTIRLGRGACQQLGRLAGRGGVPVTLTVTRRRAGKGWSWRACVGFKAVAVAKTAPIAGAESLVGADRGVAVTLALSGGALLPMPPFLGDARDAIAELLRERQARRSAPARGGPSTARSPRPTERRPNAPTTGPVTPLEA
jgi:putative transposase